MAIIYDIEQGSQEWRDLRRTKITSTDACAIMGVSPYKTREQLLQEKVTGIEPKEENIFKKLAMQKGKKYEEAARELLSLKLKLSFEPAIAISDEHPWIMASLDGLDRCRAIIVEIKYSGKLAHEKALAGHIPKKHYPQLQHAMCALGYDWMYYFDFDGFDGVPVTVQRDNDYIAKLLREEQAFYEEMKTATGIPQPVA